MCDGRRERVEKRAFLEKCVGSGEGSALKIDGALLRGLRRAMSTEYTKAEPGELHASV